MSEQQVFDSIVVGAGHNGLVAAARLARAGQRVLVLERLDRTGGAAVSTRAFRGHAARLSRYSYLVSLMPAELMAELDLDVRLASRRTASYTPYVREGRPDGLLVEHEEGAETAESFRRLTGGDEEYAAWREFYADVAQLAEVVAPTLLQPLPRAADLRSRVLGRTWEDVVDTPLGTALRRRFSDSLVRGIVATDALIGTFASMDDASLVQNRCFLYHLIGNGTGEWRVPIGGMGAVTAALEKAATTAGADLRTGVEVTAVHDHGTVDAPAAEVTWRDADGRTHSARSRHVLSNVAPWTLAGLTGAEQRPENRPVGAQLKINFLLDRLPALRSGVDPQVAFAGTLHLNEDFTDLETAWRTAAAGQVPRDLPGEVYCHSLTDRSILGPEAPEGQHTLTYFGLHLPGTLFESNPDLGRARAVSAALASLQQHLAEPLLACVATDELGNPCIEAKIPQDVEADLAMPGGHIFHGDLEWPWASDRARLETPAERWGVQTASGSVLLCGSGARRGGAVSGIGGHNAAQAVLEAD